VKGKHRRTARRRRLTRRGKLLVTGGLIVAVAGGSFAWSAFRTSGGIVIPEDPCASPPPLRTWHGVTLQPLAMTAFRKAQRQAGTPIPVVQSYRTCAEQRAACEGICQNPNGCKDLCAPPGKSWHQLGAAVDITQAGLDDPKIVQALKATGWCEPLLSSDPGHFSFGGCH
jgi:hypothetical protein